MDLSGIIDLFKTDPRTKTIVESLGSKEQTRLHLKGLRGAMSAFVTAGVYLSKPRTHLFVMESRDEAGYFQSNLKNLLGAKDLIYFPDSFKQPGELKEINKGNVLLRAEAVNKLINSHTTGELMITYPHALFEKVVDVKALQKNTIHIKKEEKLDVDFIMEVLVEYGFERVDFVYEPGEFSIRGGIVDIYSFGNELPYRVELFDDEVESIRTFDPVDQRSVKKISQVNIVPDIQKQFSSKEKISILELLPENTVVWIENPESFGAIIDECFTKALELAKSGELDTESADSPFKGEAAETFQGSGPVIELLTGRPLIAIGERPLQDAQEIHYEASPQPAFNKNFELLIKDLRQKEKSGFTPIIFAEKARQINRFNHIFEDLEANVQVHMLPESVHEGFIDNGLKIALYTDHQIFDRYYKYYTRKKFSRGKAVSLKLLRELQPGDFITHIDHGVGKYSGLEKIEVNGRTQETVRILYRDNDILYCGIQSLHKIAKYVGKEGKQPRLNKLGSDAWESVKRRTKRKIKDIAKDLIQLYAKRKASPGFAFSPDSYLQTELEASFIYEDTPDQLKATNDVKKDMEASYPMDRLVCGDVGFGKTEIAVRAAAKAVADSKQVALLVPTTILAIQHYQTFKARMSDFPANIDYINRFKTAKQKKETIQRLKEGKIDIIIGTHSLLGKSVEFQDLGLLIIDEEQKFGVAAKEKLRRFKANVDTLTLTATPIPRTLQFSLMSARDLSIMRTPPPNRQPVTTELMQYNKDKLREAIEYEVYRGGQVFFVYNRVQDIADIAAMIHKLCPDVDIGVAHGQMDGKKLEQTLIKFIDRTYDVLLSTNIIENGIDIPNANTIIIYNAHWFGLSDLHQLRGRVGRSNKKAFCYLVSPPLHSLADDSKKRLRTIEQFAELGSGFNIAMKDLDIRGAGNLLGGEQSGFIADIGYETYQKILNEAIQELKEGAFREVFQDQLVSEQVFVTDCQIETDSEMMIPDYYVRSVNERMNLYKEIDDIADEEALETFKASIKDRFGRIPGPVSKIFDGLKLRWQAKRLGFEKVTLKKNKLRCYFLSNEKSAFYDSPTFAHMMAFLTAETSPFKLKKTAKSLILIAENIVSIDQAEEVLKQILKFVVLQKELA